MPPSLHFTDPQGAADALTFARRAATLPDPAVRFVAARGVLAMSTAVLAPRGLADPVPTVIALRTTGVDPELETDVVVDPAGLHADPVDAAAVSLPATGLRAAWAGISPPQTEWESVGTVPASTLAEIAHAGVAEVAQALPSQPGEDVARTIRAGVWSRPADGLHALPAGAAFAALALGFIGGAEGAQVLASGAWRRVTLRRGHVLVRGPIAHGLTAVRRTG